MKILLADDSAAMRKVFRSIFEALGHVPDDLCEVVDGAGLQEALQDLSMRYDLILADAALPGMDGHTLLRRVGLLKPARRPYVVLSVASNQRRFSQEAQRLGVRDLVVRPFTDEELRQKLTLLEASIRAQRAEQARAALHAIAASGQVDAGLPFLLQLPSAALADFLAVAAPRRVPAGTALLMRGEAVDRLHVITSGEAEIHDEARPRPPDILGPGETFGEAAFLSGAKSDHAVRARTEVQVASIDRPQLAALLQRQPGLSEQLGALAERRASAAPASRSGSEFFGSLRSMSFSDLVQLLNVSRKCGVLQITREGLTGELGFDAGEVVHARLGPAAGEEAFYAVAAWTEATFAFKSGRAPEARNVGRPTGPLLMEAMRRADAARKAPVSA